MPGSRMLIDRNNNSRSLRYQQVMTVALLFGGYAALYFCRADLSVATPLLIDELTQHSLTHGQAVIRIGAIASFGVLAYALGKLFLCGLGDIWGGKVSFLIGLGGAALFTVLFATSSFVPVFTLAWFGNRLTQSVAWAGLLKVSSKWFDFSSYGTVVGILSVSFLIGDAVARQWMGLLIRDGSGWRPLFYLAAGMASLFFVANAWFLRESRVDQGFTAATPNPLNLYSTSEAQTRSLRELLLPLLRSRAYLLVCLLSLGCTIVRETFNTWTPVYLHDYLGYSMSNAAGRSAIFPAVGAVSVLAAGWLSDQFGVNGRSLLLLLGLSATAAMLIVLMSMHSAAGTLAPLLVIGAIAFCLLGPYSYLGGAFALDFGGKQASAMASGIIDGVGYLGAVVAGDSVARISVAFGWSGVFLGLSAVSALAAVGAALLYMLNARAAAAGRPLP